MDWGLLEKQTDAKLLREETVYRFRVSHWMGGVTIIDTKFGRR